MKDDKDSSDNKDSSKATDPGGADTARRRLLQRLGLGALAATLVYASPVLLDLSEASASRGSWGSRGSRRSRGSRSRSRGSRGRHLHHHHHHYRSRGSRGWSQHRRRSDGADVHIWLNMKDVF